MTSANHTNHDTERSIHCTLRDCGNKPVSKRTNMRITTKDNNTGSAKLSSGVGPCVAASARKPNTKTSAKKGNTKPFVTERPVHRVWPLIAWDTRLVTAHATPKHSNKPSNSNHHSGC